MYVAIGELSSWWGWSHDLDEVYVLRFGMEGRVLDLSNTNDAIKHVINPIGEAMKATSQTGLDLQGVAINGESGTYVVDAVFVFNGGDMYRINADNFVEAVLTIAGASSCDPSPEWLELTGPPDAVTYWWSRMPLWVAKDSPQASRWTDGGAAPAPSVILQNSSSYPWGISAVTGDVDAPDVQERQIPPPSVTPIPIDKPKPEPSEFCGPGPGKCSPGKVCCKFPGANGGWCEDEATGCGSRAEVSEFSNTGKVNPTPYIVAGVGAVAVIAFLAWRKS